MRRFAFAIVIAIALFGCAKPSVPHQLVAHAELGIFFGGQVQEREQIPFTIDRAKQTQGFRIRFTEPLSAPARVRWEIDQPAPKGRGRVARLSETQARIGMEQLDQELEFKPGDPLGVWNVRVLIDDELVIDRPILVFDPVLRQRARQEEKARAENTAAPARRR